MQYWLDLFTGTTWDEFRKAGANVTGFSHRLRRTVAKVQRGDVLLCYLTGVSRWVGALEVIGPSDDKRRIWSLSDFPSRLAVRPLILLDPANGVPMTELKGKVDFFQSDADRSRYKGFIRRSPNPFKRQGDGQAIMHILREAQANPVSRPVDPVKLARKPLLKAERRKGKKTVPTLVSIPEADEDGGGTETTGEGPEISVRPHTEIQHRLLRLGAEMGFDVWVARNDRNKTCNGETFGEMKGMVAELPTQFNEATNRTVELIDVLWLRGNSIEAAFEVECTTAIYSGLLRMSDLLALQPNLKIRLYIVAPSDRKAKVEQEILRPTFMIREKPVSEVCGFLSIEDLTEKIDALTRLGVTAHLKPEFLEQIAKYFTQGDAG